MPQGEVLTHTNKGVIDRSVAVRVVLTDDVTDDGCALHVVAVGTHALVEHAPEDPPLYRLQPITRIGQRPGHDDRHGVVQEGLLHLLLDLDRLDVGGKVGRRDVRHLRCPGSARRRRWQQ